MNGLVRIRFHRNSALYTYRCPGAKVGSLVRVPETPVAGPRTLKVVKLGRGWTYWGPVKDAVLVRR